MSKKHLSAQLSWPLGGPLTSNTERTHMLSKAKGTTFVAIAAILWSTDALIRYPFIQNIEPLFLILVEHILAVAILLPICLLFHRNKLFDLTPREWISAIFSGAAGSALATLFFCESFLYINPSVAVLLQKLQPVFVVLIAYLFLGERPKKRFYFWGTLAIVAVIFLSFPDLNFKFLFGKMDLRSKGFQYAAGAALIWAASTVTGKALLEKTSPTIASFWRFFFGMVVLVGMAAYSGLSPHSVPETPEALFSLLYLSLVPGLLAVFIYYKGLAKTPASVVTFIELLYPIAAVVLNTFFLNTPLDHTQVIAGIALVLAVAMISF